jgi:nucleotide-binding universal stress UspA family protein
MSKDFKTIVIGTSLTELCDGVVRTGAAVARAAGASPWLVHAYMQPGYGSETLDGRWLELQAGSVREGLAKQALRTGLAELAGFKPEQLCSLIGSPAGQIADLARQVKADLIVVGAEEGGMLHRIFLGSTAAGVIRKAPCPVLAVRSEAAFPPTRVEVPVDLSPISAGAYRRGLSFLAEIGVALTDTEVLFVLNPFEVGGSIHFTPEQIERFAGEELRDFIHTNSHGAAPHLGRIRTGYPRSEILDVLKQRQADLAILGTHGRTGLERLALGSVASEVMHQASCNLLLIPPEAGAAKEDTLRELPLKSADWTFVSDEVPVLAGGS